MFRQIARHQQASMSRVLMVSASQSRKASFQNLWSAGKLMAEVPVGGMQDLHGNGSIKIRGGARAPDGDKMRDMPLFQTGQPARTADSGGFGNASGTGMAGEGSETSPD